MSSTPTSDASTKIGSDSSVSTEEEKTLTRRTFERTQRAATSQDILLFLVAFRVLNTLSIRTFFQPDEYFQSLEPAWEIAFGKDSGAWITWVNWLNASMEAQCADKGNRNGNTSFGLPFILLSSPQSTGLHRAFRTFYGCPPNGMPILW